MDLHEKALEIHRRLCRAYGCPIAYFHTLDPLSELVSSLLSHRTRNADSGAAFKALRQRFPDWAAVAAAPMAEVQAAIAGVTWPEQKAPRIQSILRAIQAERGALSLDFLADLPVEDARAWLERLPGVGPKTSAAVLSFSTLRRPALPVDSHHHRVAARTGLIPSGLAVGPSHRVLAAQLPARPALLLLPQTGLHALLAAGAVPNRAGPDAGCGWCRRRRSGDVASVMAWPNEDAAWRAKPMTCRQERRRNRVVLTIILFPLADRFPQPRSANYDRATAYRKFPNCGM
jgi:endonuclease III